MKKLVVAFLYVALSLVSNLSVAEERYTLNAGDILNISVWNEEALQKEIIVLPDGTISFPLAGEIIAEGRTISELESELKTKLSDFISDPFVNVSVYSVNGNSVHILGKVQNPGSFTMNQPLDVMQALSLAGGLSTYAKENDILILRRQGDKQQIIPVYYAEIKKGQSLQSNVRLQSGDVIIIP